MSLNNLLAYVLVCKYFGNILFLDEYQMEIACLQLSIFVTGRR